jgi:acyl carrier protein
VSNIDVTVRSVIDELACLTVSLSSLGDDDDLYDLGMSSHASVNVMLGLEDAFEVEFPDELLRMDTFRSVSAIRSALLALGVQEVQS